MAGLHLEGLGVEVTDQKKGCYYQNGCYAATDLQHAVILKGQPGFDRITDDVIRYRQERSSVAGGCSYSKTGECALKAADMLGIYPE
jgi:hypothetical protein